MEDQSIEGCFSLVVKNKDILKSAKIPLCIPSPLLYISIIFLQDRTLDTNVVV